MESEKKDFNSEYIGHGKPIEESELIDIISYKLIQMLH